LQVSFIFLKLPIVDNAKLLKNRNKAAFNRGLSAVLKRLKNRILVENLSPASIVSYNRAASKFSLLQKRTPDDLDLGEIMDFLVHLKEVAEIKGGKIKLV